MKKLTAILLGATALTVATTGDVHAAPVAAAVLGFIAPALAASPLAVGIATLALSFAASIGLSLLQRALQGGKKQEVGGTSGKLQAGGIVNRTIPFGTYPASHSLVYANSYGRINKTPNAFLVQVFQLSDVPITGLSELYVNGTKVTVSGSANADGLFPVTEFFKPVANGKGSADHLWIRVYDGSQSSADSFLTGKFGSDPDYPWTSTRVGTGCAYAVVVARYNPEVFSGFPQFKFVVQGAKFYDPRLDTTAGGSGAHRWDNQSTWAWSDNPALIAYNLMRGVTHGGEWLHGGQTITAGQLPFSSWVAAMNACDQTVNLAGGGTEKQYRCGGEITTARTAADIIEDILATCAGRLSQVGGVYKISVGAPGVSVFSFTDSDILSTEAQTFEPFKAIGDRANQVTAKYVEPLQGWSAKDAPPLVSSTYLAQDGKVSLAPLTIDFAPFPVQVQRLMKSGLEENRRERKHRLPMPIDAWVLEPGDFVSWSSTRNGYTNKLFRVDGVNDGANHVIGLDLTEVDPADYSWTPGSDQRAIVAPSIVPLVAPAQPMQDWAASGVEILGADGRKRPGILLSWNSDQEDVSGVQFEVYETTGTSVIWYGETDRWDEGSIAITSNLVGNTNYRVRGRYRPASSRPTSWSALISVTTPDTRFLGRELADGTIDFDQLAAPVKATLDKAFADLQDRVEDISQALQSQRSIRDGVSQRVRLAIADDVERLSEAVAWLVDQQVSLRDAAVEAGLEITSVEGKARIRAVADLSNSTASRFQSVQISLDALAGQISLITGVNVSGLDGLTQTISTVQTQLNALSASLTNYVTQAQRTADQATITTITQDLSALTGTVATKANNTTVTALETRTTTVETNINALTGSIGLLSQSVQSDTDVELTRQTLQDILGSLVERTDKVDSSLASASLTLGSRITANGQSIATLQVDLNSLSASAGAQFSSLTQTIASNNAASVSRDDALTAALANETTARGQAISSLSTRVTATEDSITSQGSSLTSLTNRVGTAESNISGNTSAISGLTTTVNSQGGTITAQGASITSIQSQVNNVSASGSVGFATIATASGAQATYALRLQAGSVDAGMFIDAISGAGSRIRFRADRFVIEGTNGAPSFQLNSTNSGARIRYENNKISIIDANGVVRVELGF